MPNWREQDVPFVIERLGPGSDIEGVVALEAASFTNPWPRDVLAREMGESSVSRLFVLRTPEVPVAAFCLCWLIVDELHINTIAVDPVMRRQGFATALMRHVIADAVREGARRATLEVRRSNAAAIALYERMGFRLCAVRPAYYANPVEDALILWHDGPLDQPGPP